MGMFSQKQFCVIYEVTKGQVLPPNPIPKFPKGRQRSYNCSSVAGVHAHSPIYSLRKTMYRVFKVINVSTVTLDILHKYFFLT